MINFKTYRTTKTTATQFHFNSDKQVVCIFIVKCEVCIASNPECTGMNDVHANKQVRNMCCNDIFNQDVSAFRHLLKTLEKCRDFYAGKSLLARRRIAHQHSKADRHVGDIREWMRRINSKWCEHWKQLTLKEFFHLNAFFIRSVCPTTHIHPVRG